jgi:hypothetical protein
MGTHVGIKLRVSSRPYYNLTVTFHMQICIFAQTKYFIPSLSTGNHGIGLIKLTPLS